MVELYYITYSGGGNQIYTTRCNTPLRITTSDIPPTLYSSIKTMIRCEIFEWIE